MPIIDVTGIGEVEFPDTMSDDDIVKAIETELVNHPDYKTPEKELPIPNVGGKMMVNPAAVYEMMRGVPILGKYLPEATGSKELNEQNPIQAGINRGMGNLAFMGPASYGTMAATGTKLLPAIAGQTALFSGANIGDTVAEKGMDITREDIKEDLKYGAITGIMGPVLNKAISPNYLPRPRPIPAPKPVNINTPILSATQRAEISRQGPEAISKVESMLNKNQELMRKAIEGGAQQAHTAKVAAQEAEFAKKLSALQGSGKGDTLNQILWGLGSAGLGHLALPGGAGVMLGAALSPIARNYGPNMMAKYLGNQAMNPANRAMLNAIIQGGTTEGVH